jgi:hypothetical protein
MTAKPDHVELTAASRALTVSPLFAGRSMSRIVPAVVAGLILGQVTALIFWWWGFYLSPPSLLYDMSPALARSHPGGLPFMALLWQALGQGLGAYLGGAWAGRIAREGPAAAWGVGGLCFIAALMWMVVFPRPFWFPVMSALFIGAAGWAAGRRAPGPQRRAA